MPASIIYTLNSIFLYYRLGLLPSSAQATLRPGLPQPDVGHLGPARAPCFRSAWLDILVSWKQRASCNS